MGLVLRRSTKHSRINVYDREGRRCTLQVTRVRPNGDVDIHCEGDDFLFYREEVDPANKPAMSP